MSVSIEEATNALNAACSPAEFEAATAMMTNVQAQQLARLTNAEAEEKKAEIYCAKVDQAKADIHPLTIEYSAIKDEIEDLGPRSRAINATEWDAEQAWLKVKKDETNDKLSRATKTIENKTKAQTTLQEAARAATPIQQQQLPFFFNSSPFPSFPFMPPPPTTPAKAMKLPKESEKPLYKFGDKVYDFMDRFENAVKVAMPSSDVEFKKLVHHCVDTGTSGRVAGCRNEKELGKQLLATALQINPDEVSNQVFHEVTTTEMKESESTVTFNNRIASKLRRTTSSLTKQDYYRLLPTYLREKLFIDAIPDLKQLMATAERRSNSRSTKDTQVAASRTLPEAKKPRPNSPLEPMVRTLSTAAATTFEGGQCPTHTDKPHGLLTCFNPDESHERQLIARGYIKECAHCKAANVLNKQITFRHFEQCCRNKFKKHGPSVTLKFQGLDFGETYYITANELKDEGNEGSGSVGGFFF
ncbi:hypothetical protein HDU99_003869 [Rhizoclosmatium hyalinum]|nr:hypothetical protein HDU99_003869 [Rhizoclosmatium hyalinum]